MHYHFFCPAPKIQSRKPLFRAKITPKFLSPPVLTYHFLVPIGALVYIAVYSIVWMLLRRVAIYNGSISPKSQCQILHILIHHYYISYSHILAKGFFFKFNVTEIFFLLCTICDNILRNISIQNVLLHCAFFEGLYYMLNKSL